MQHRKYIFRSGNCQREIAECDERCGSLRTVHFFRLPLPQRSFGDNNEGNFEAAFFQQIEGRGGAELREGIFGKDDVPGRSGQGVRRRGGRPPPARKSPHRRRAAVYQRPDRHPSLNLQQSIPGADGPSAFPSLIRIIWRRGLLYHQGTLKRCGPDESFSEQRKYKAKQITSQSVLIERDGGERPTKRKGDCLRT